MARERRYANPSTLWRKRRLAGHTDRGCSAQITAGPAREKNTKRMEMARAEPQDASAPTLVSLDTRLYRAQKDQIPRLPPQQGTRVTA